MHLLFLSEFRVLNFFMNFLSGKRYMTEFYSKKLPWDPKFHNVAQVE